MTICNITDIVSLMSFYSNNSQLDQTQGVNYCILCPSSRTVCKVYIFFKKYLPSFGFLFDQCRGLQSETFHFVQFKFITLGLFPLYTPTEFKKT